MSRFDVSGGQFFQWRFMARDLWWHSHPYSISAMPRPPFIRVTIKRLGMQSLAATRLKPGTRVFVEGPYGVFTRHAHRGGRVILIGAGVGISPIRALLEDLPPKTDVTVILRATNVEDLVHRAEVTQLVNERDGSAPRGRRDHARRCNSTSKCCRNWSATSTTRTSTSAGRLASAKTSRRP